MIDINRLFSDKNELAAYYSSFDVESRILLTGHSHQAWPDCAFDGMREYWDDAATYVDDKWDKAFKKADLVRKGFGRLLDAPSEQIALGQNTHDLLVKLLSALDLKDRNKIITTDAEFHTVRRQLDKLNDIGLIKLDRINALPVVNLAERIARRVDDKTSIVIVSKVFYSNSLILENIKSIQDKCSYYGACLLVDAYHALNAIPFSVIEEGLEESFIIGGGYKYCQLGEGNCFLRIPEGSALKPVITGWFSEFSSLAGPKTPGEVVYGEGNQAFAGSTYDPVSNYRAAIVFDFFEKMGLTPEFLRKLNRMQTELLISEFDKYDFHETVIKRDCKLTRDKKGAFLVLESPYAGSISNDLKKQGILTDYRGNNLRLGPAPYLNKQQLKKAIEVLYGLSRRLSG